MANDYREKDMNSDSEALDRELDAALQRYGSVEPRPGFEQRILANLRAVHQHDSAWGWWRWPAVVAAAALVIAVALSLGFRSVHQQPGLAVRIPSITAPRGIQRGTQGTAKSASVKKHAARMPRGLPLVAENGPRLEQFPSPRPLSEQEKILQSYVMRFPENAALIAQARTEALQRDLAEEMTDSAAKDSIQ